MSTLHDGMRDAIKSRSRKSEKKGKIKSTPDGCTSPDVAPQGHESNSVFEFRNFVAGGRALGGMTT